MEQIQEIRHLDALDMPTPFTWCRAVRALRSDLLHEPIMPMQFSKQLHLQHGMLQPMRDCPTTFTRFTTRLPGSFGQPANAAHFSQVSGCKRILALNLDHDASVDANNICCSSQRLVDTSRAHSNQDQPDETKVSAAKRRCKLQWRHTGP